jgi:hypothetical protein
MPLVYKVHPVNENYKGRSYGEWVATWTNWLLSDQADYAEANDVLFLRGNIGYYQDLDKFYNKTNENAETIYTGTAVLLPIINTFLTIGGYYEGSKIESEIGLRYAVNRTVHAGTAAWAKIKLRNGTNNVTDIPNLLGYYVESPLFKLFVSERSKFLDKFDEPFEPGVYDAITGGYFMLLTDLDADIYRVRFGGKGKGNYITDSIYDIIVLGSRRQTPREIFLTNKGDKSLLPKSYKSPLVQPRKEFGI